MGVYKAYCSSIACNKNTRAFMQKEIVGVKKFDTYCPHCGNALFWEKVGTKKTYANSKLNIVSEKDEVFSLEDDYTFHL